MYAPSELLEMLLANADLPPARDARGQLIHEQYGWRYNEVVIDASAYNRLLPEAIDAFVYPTDAGIGGTPHTVEAAHHEFVSLYAPHAAKHGKPLAPLVRLDVSNWARPFELMKEAT